MSTPSAQSNVDLLSLLELETCPLTHLPVRSDSSWRDIELTPTYRVSFAVLGSSTLLTIPSGNAGQEGMPRLFRNRERVLREAGLWDAPYTEIKTYDMIDRRPPFRGRAQFTRLLLDEGKRGQLRGYWGFGGPGILRWVMRVAAFPYRHMGIPCEFVDSYEEAVQRAQRALQRGFALPAGGEATDQLWELDTGDYRTTARYLGDGVLHFEAHGLLTHRHVEPYVELLERALVESGCAEMGRFWHISDSRDMKGITWRARQHWIRRAQALYRKYNCQGWYVVTRDPGLGALLGLTQLFFPFPVRYVPSNEAALAAVRSQRRGADRQHGGAPAARAWYSAAEVEASAQHVVDFARHIDWDREGVDELPAIPDDDPLRLVLATLAVLKLDFDEVIRDRAEIQTQMLQAEKLAAVGTLTTGVAHELNSPLTAVIGHAERLSQKEFDARTRATAAKILRAGTRMKAIIDRMGQYGRRSTDRAHSTISVVGPLQDAVALVESHLTDRGIDIEVQLEQDLPAIQGNAHELESVFQNLLVNACDALDEVEQGRPRRITVQALFDPPWVCVRIADSGVGISDAACMRAFEPFFTTKDVGKGTGLGLYISRRVVAQHKGRLKVEPGESSGTVAEVRLPAAGSNPS